MIEIRLNGDPMTLEAGVTLAELLEVLGLDPRRLAVERNLEVAPRGEHAQLVLQDGDRLEVVTLVGGG
jgi:thiamine biosynthesis protein ThiS